MHIDSMAATLPVLITVAGMALGAACLAGPSEEATPAATREGAGVSGLPPHPLPASPPPAAAKLPPVSPTTTGSAGHPTVDAPPQTGRAHQSVPVDPQAKFTHFRVGQRNVKQILADGDYMWVGTSGGVIRYNTKTDDYKLFAVRSGLLANGIFHIGNIAGRTLVGTYAGRMAV